MRSLELGLAEAEAAAVFSHLDCFGHSLEIAVEGLESFASDLGLLLNDQSSTCLDVIRCNKHGSFSGRRDLNYEEAIGRFKKMTSLVQDNAVLSLCEGAASLRLG